MGSTERAQLIREQTKLGVVFIQIFLTFIILTSHGPFSLEELDKSFAIILGWGLNE